MYRTFHFIAFFSCRPFKSLKLFQKHFLLAVWCHTLGKSCTCFIWAKVVRALYGQKLYVLYMGKSCTCFIWANNWYYLSLQNNLKQVNFTLINKKKIPTSSLIFPFFWFFPEFPCTSLMIKKACFSRFFQVCLSPLSLSMKILCWFAVVACEFQYILFALV